MTSRYRVEYALKSHRRDEFIEWIKALLAVPFVLHADVENYHVLQFSNLHDYENHMISRERDISLECQKRYYEVFEDVERLVLNTILLDQKSDEPRSASRLRKLVPTIGTFFTPLPLADAFMAEDAKKCISKRRLVAPSFNDVRNILNMAQVLALSTIYNDPTPSRLKLLTFDGDVTLYEDGKSLEHNSPVVSRLIWLLKKDFFVGVVTAAGYPGQSGAVQYYGRLKGLVDAINSDNELKDYQKENLLIMGGESNYLFRFSNELQTFRFIESTEWYLPLMRQWSPDRIEVIMDNIHRHLKHLQSKFNLNDENKTTIIRKERSVGLIPVNGFKILREILEEIVMSCSVRLNDLMSSAKDEDKSIKVCAFNGGSDVWVDIGDKSLGVECLQNFLCKDESIHHLCPILKSETLHVGDQFASVGANDFKARLSACTVWIANPQETVEILDDLAERLH